MYDDNDDGTSSYLVLEKPFITNMAILEKNFNWIAESYRGMVI